MAELRWNASVDEIVHVRVACCDTNGKMGEFPHCASQGAMSFDDARERCRGAGYRMCHEEEIARATSTVAQGGCGLDGLACGLTDSVLCLHFKTSSLGSVVMTAKSWRGPNTPACISECAGNADCSVVRWPNDSLDAVHKACDLLRSCAAPDYANTRFVHMRVPSDPVFADNVPGYEAVRSGSTMASEPSPHARNCVIFWTIMMRLCLVGILPGDGVVMIYGIPCLFLNLWRHFSLLMCVLRRHLGERLLESTDQMPPIRLFVHFTTAVCQDTRVLLHHQHNQHN